MDVRYEDVVVVPTADGWAQRHVIHADGANGFAIRGLRACMIVRLHGDRIGRIYEYLDSAQAGGFDNSRLVAPAD
ncbi:hypothetical protein [Sphingomonas sp. Leaf412]|uniref:hypothetical protein n=1 Tax=Sphingomonas sp. Leaf412 TaxID=1736370 RepID=UPI0009EB70AB|nr:hypothetical protein [Sphingomonas sp. Leaf412]